jgi:hypothetical protein
VKVVLWMVMEPFWFWDLKGRMANNCVRVGASDVKFSSRKTTVERFVFDFHFDQFPSACTHKHTRSREREREITGGTLDGRKRVAIHDRAQRGCNPPKNKRAFRFRGAPRCTINHITTLRRRHLVGETVRMIERDEGRRDVPA